jgi:PRC-barrel domain
MTGLRRWRIVVLAMAPVAMLLIDAAASQTQSELAQTNRRGAVEGNSAQDRDPAAPQLKGIRSVLGIEVRSSHEKNIGRIVDLLADRNGGVDAAVIEFGGFIGIGTRKFAISWSDLRFATDGNQLVAILDIPADQLRAAPDYKPDQPTIVTRVTKPVIPSTEEPARAVTEKSPAAKEAAKENVPPRRKRHRRGRH